MNRTQLAQLDTDLRRFYDEHVGGDEPTPGAQFLIDQITGMITHAEPDNSPDSALQALLDSRIACVGCTVERRRAQIGGTPEDQLPEVNGANLIINGMGQCYSHVQIVDGPVLPGQTAGGLFLPGAN